MGSETRAVETLDQATFNERYHDWWTPHYWEAVLEMQRIAVEGAEIVVYGTSTSRYGTRWRLMIRPQQDRRR